MDVETKLDATVASTLDTNNKIQRLTYSATSKVVDPEMQLEKIKKEQGEILKAVIAEERAAEEHRESKGRTVTDPEERDRLDNIFAEERRRASDRIIAATKAHENAVKGAVLAMMNLGVTLKAR
jgi:cystathionine beta-lyase family protein involved in aluminum resistance